MLIRIFTSGGVGAGSDSLASLKPGRSGGTRVASAPNSLASLSRNALSRTVNTSSNWSSTSTGVSKRSSRHTNAVESNSQIPSVRNSGTCSCSVLQACLIERATASTGLSFFSLKRTITGRKGFCRKRGNSEAWSNEVLPSPDFANCNRTGTLRTRR